MKTVPTVSVVKRGFSHLNNDLLFNLAQKGPDFMKLSFSINVYLSSIQPVSTNVCLDYQVTCVGVKYYVVPNAYLINVHPLNTDFIVTTNIIPT